MHETMKCSKCGHAAEGFKCEVCGTESKEHDSNHVCGGDHCVVKCSGCNEAHTKCTCSISPSEPANA